MYARDRWTEGNVTLYAVDEVEIVFDISKFFLAEI